MEPMRKSVLGSPPAWANRIRRILLHQNSRALQRHGGTLIDFLGGLRKRPRRKPVERRSLENQRYRASGLNLVLAAITLWNTVYLDRAVTALRTDRSIDEALLPHLSPLSWEHIHLTGDYTWHANKRVAKGGFGPLRQRREPLVEP